MGLFLIHLHILQNIAVCWEDFFMCLKFMTISTRQGHITELIFPNRISRDFSRLGWSYLGWPRIEIEMSSEVSTDGWIEQVWLLLTLVSRGTSSRSIFLHYSANSGKAFSLSKIVFLCEVIKMSGGTAPLRTVSLSLGPPQTTLCHFHCLSHI